MGVSENWGYPFRGVPLRGFYSIRSIRGAPLSWEMRILGAFCSGCAIFRTWCPPLPQSKVYVETLTINPKPQTLNPKP